VSQLFSPLRLRDRADATSIAFVYLLCAFLPAIGLLVWLLTHIETEGQRQVLPAFAVDIAGNVDAPPRSVQ